MLFYKVDDLKPGMRLGKPIYNKNGVLLYDRDTKLTMQAIYGIKNFGLMGLYILEPAEPLPPMTEDDINFERFQTMAVFSIKEDLQLIIAGKKDKGLDWLCSLVIKNYANLPRKITFIQNLRSKDDYIYKHSINVAILTAVIAGKMNLNPSRLNALVKAALLHDCGAVGTIPAMEEEEDQQLRAAARAKTLEILRSYGNMDDNVLRTIIHMQELYVNNGNGVSEAVQNNVEAAILFVADAYDRMTAMKSFEEPTSEVRALRMLLEEPERFEPRVVQALIQGINVLYPGVCVELSDHIQGLVILENKEDIFKPWVLSFRDNKIYDLSNPRTCGNLQLIDIMKTMDNRIKLDPDLLKQYSQSE
ncbi:MAG: HD domain-containing protein [Clostridiales bacterium]|nr:HD domain-containing protein [Eubacterium sp.]MDD7349646.1 HD domain-containing protein [Clostridiales bacterium]MDY3775538.1 HD domain-containing protein [Eubacterium sp.]